MRTCSRDCWLSVLSAPHFPVAEPLLTAGHTAVWEKDDSSQPPLQLGVACDKVLANEVRVEFFLDSFLQSFCRGCRAPAPCVPSYPPAVWSAQSLAVTQSLAWGVGARARPTRAERGTGRGWFPRVSGGQPSTCPQTTTWERKQLISPGALFVVTNFLY